jgi:hypothetical protein
MGRLDAHVWVVWTLGALFGSPVGADLTFKGGTSLSKAYRIIDRFSEDLDLTYDIRSLIADLIRGEEFLPTNRAQATRWTKAVRHRLPSGSRATAINSTQKLRHSRLPPDRAGPSTNGDGCIRC